MDPDVRAAYLQRLGLEAEPPSADALHRLHQRQVERVPYETTWIALGERWGIDVDDSAVRIARRGRGGYCFHLNGAFGELLHSLGYLVTRHVGGVHGPEGPSDDIMANHLVLTVSGLPSADNESGVWYVDAGLGDALHQPIPLVEATYRQGPFAMALERTPGGVGDWHLTHDPSGGFAGMSWRSAEITMDAFATKHDWLSTSPESGFVRVVTAQRREAAGVDVVRGLVLSRIERGSTQTQTLSDRGDWFDVLAELFGLRFDDVDAAALDAMWTRLFEAHLVWDAAGRP